MPPPIRPQPPTRPTLNPSTPDAVVPLASTRITTVPDKRPDAFDAAAARTSAPVLGGPPVARTAATTASKEAFFAALDADPALRTKAQSDAVGALLDVLSRTDVPPALDREYADKAGSPGGGRVLMALDYTRGIPSHETFWQALRQGPMHLLSEKVVTPLLTHFREVNGASLFPGDATMTPAFRDSSMWGPKTNQVGHLLCAVEAGARLGHLSTRPVERKAFDLALMAAGGVAGFKNVEGNAADWSRAGILGHEMRGDGDGSGFLGQMRAYDTLVGNGDHDHIRQHWDQAVAAVLANNHDEAWKHIKALGAAIEAPATPAEVASNLANDHPRFAPAHQPREGNSLEDVALSVYGFATGFAATTRGFATPDAARDHFETLYSARGADAGVIDRAAMMG